MLAIVFVTTRRKAEGFEFLGIRVVSESCLTASKTMSVLGTVDVGQLLIQKKLAAFESPCSNLVPQSV